MNKTVNVNIAGLSFTLDEDAFARLKEYLDRLKVHFSRDEGHDEIMRDIEARLAEMLLDLLGKKHVVGLIDVQAVIKQMGMPEDFEVPEDQTQPKQEAGIEEEPTDRRFYRDTDHAVIGGVCSGISGYFNVDPIWLRLAFVVGLFVFGSGLLLYLVLWIIMPEAKTTADRLRMKGKRTTVSNIEKDFKEGFKRAGEEVRRATRGSNMRAGFERFTDRFGGTFIRLIGIFFVVVGVIMLASLVATIVGGGSVLAISFPKIQQYLLSPGWPQSLSSLALILLIGVPIIVLLVKGISALMKLKFKSRVFNLSMLLAWLTGVGFAVAIGVDLGADFSSRGSVEKETVFASYDKDVMYVKLARPRAYSTQLHGSHGDFHLDESMISDDTLFLDDFIFNITQTSDSVFSLVTRYSARGESAGNARLTASRIEHRHWLKDSTLFVDPVYSIGDQPWRVQKVEMELRVPSGKRGLVDVEMLGLASRTTTVEVHNGKPYVKPVERFSDPIRTISSD